VFVQTVHILDGGMELFELEYPFLILNNPLFQDDEFPSEVGSCCLCADQAIEQPTSAHVSPLSATGLSDLLCFLTM
jgi:hypothetical protein